MKYRFVLFLGFVLLTLFACTSSNQTQVLNPGKTIPTETPEPTFVPLLPETYMLMGTNWLWQSYTQTGSSDTIEITDPDKYLLIMYVDGQAYTLADCKDSYGSYVPSGKNLSIFLDAVPEIACSEGSLADLFIDYILKVTRFEFKEDQLILWVGDEAKLFFINGGPAGD